MTLCSSAEDINNKIIITVTILHSIRETVMDSLYMSRDSLHDADIILSTVDNKSLLVQ